MDNSATTPLSPIAKEAILSAMEVYGNPSSLHPVGQAAHTRIETARREIMASLGARNGEGQLLFTASGTEANNLAILGAAYAKPRRRGGRILTTDSEHPSVDAAMQALQADGFEVVRIPTREGVLDLAAFAEALNDRVFLVSMMMVNNESGARYDLSRAFSMAKSKNRDIVTHTDAVQGYLKCKFTPKALGADLVTVSAHKIHGPKGVGALFVSSDALRRRDLVPVTHGGGQEGGFRSGTENVIGISAFGAAAKEGMEQFSSNILRMKELREYACERLSELPVHLNLPKGESAPHILNLTLPDIRSETMLHALSQSGICISHGSACSSHSAKHSAALVAFGLRPEQIECSVRISFSSYNTKEDVDALVIAMSDAIGRLVRVKR